MRIFSSTFATQRSIALLGPGEYFGEMAVLIDQPRTATAQADTEVRLKCIEKIQFLSLLKAHPILAGKVQRQLNQRAQERILKDNLVKTMGLDQCMLHVGIKGDPSLRESAFTRERYQSLADQVLPNLLPQLEKLLLERSAYQWTLHFNSGEVRVASVFNPFHDAPHPAEKMVNPFPDYP